MRLAVTRRVFLYGTACGIAGAQNLKPAVSAVDHLLLACPILTRESSGWSSGQASKPCRGSSSRRRHSEPAAVAGQRPLPGDHRARSSANAYNVHIYVRRLPTPHLITFAAL